MSNEEQRKRWLEWAQDALNAKALCMESLVVDDTERKELAAVLLAQEVELTEARELLQRSDAEINLGGTPEMSEAELEAELERMREGIAIMKETHKATSDLCDLRDREIARLREENAKMGALLERFQVGIQMSGYSTDWQKHLYDDIETERYLDGSMPREAGDASGRPNKDTDVAEGAVEATESAAPLDEESPVDILHEVCGGEVDLQEALVEAHAVMMHMTEGAFQCPAVDDWERRYGELIAPATVDTDESPVGFVQVGEPQPQGQSITASASTEAEVAGDLKATFDGPTNSFEIAAEDKPELHLPLRKGRDKKSGLMLEVVDTNGNFICEAESEVTANAIVEAVNGWHGLEGADDLAKALAKESVKLRQRVAELEAENEALSRVAKSYKVTCAELVKSEGENAQMRALLCEWSSEDRPVADVAPAPLRPLLEEITQCSYPNIREWRSIKDQAMQFLKGLEDDTDKIRDTQTVGGSIQPSVGAVLRDSDRDNTDATSISDVCRDTSLKPLGRSSFVHVGNSPENIASAINDAMERVNQWTVEVVAAIAEVRQEHADLATWQFKAASEKGDQDRLIEKMQEQIADLRDAEVSGLNIDNSLIERIEKLENEAANKTTTRDLNDRIEKLMEAVLSLYTAPTKEISKLRALKEGE